MNSGLSGLSEYYSTLFKFSRLVPSAIITGFINTLQLLPQQFGWKGYMCRSILLAAMR